MGKRTPERPREGMLERAKNGSQEARLRSRTIRKDLPVGRIHTHTHTHMVMNLIRALFPSFYEVRLASLVRV